MGVKSLRMDFFLSDNSFYLCRCIEVTLNAVFFNLLKIKKLCITVIKRMENFGFTSPETFLMRASVKTCMVTIGLSPYFYCQAEQLNEDGMVVDFTHIKEVVKGQLDHKNLNDVLPCNPTAENIARWICEQVPHCVKVEVCESEGNRVIYEKD